MAKLKGAFAGCQWCGGNGCMMCDSEREKWLELQRQPMFVADRNDSEDIEALKRVVGYDAVMHAFGPEGRGMQEIRETAALESLKQCLRKRERNSPET